MTSTSKSTRNSKSATNSKGPADNNVQSSSTSHDIGESGIVESMLTSGPNNPATTQQPNPGSASDLNPTSGTTQSSQSVNTQSQSAGKSNSDSLPNQPDENNASATTPNVGGNAATEKIVHDLTTQSTGPAMTSKSPRKAPNEASTQPNSLSKGSAAEKRGNRDLSNDQGYLSLLSNKPAEAVFEYTIAVENLTEIDLSDTSEVWKRAIDLASAGKVEEATMYFKLHAQLQTRTEKTTNQSPPNPTTTHSSYADAVSNRSQASTTIVVEGGLSFIPGAITSHTDIGFTPYFDQNLRELRGPIPLTIFNKHWQELANSYHVEKRVKTDNLNKDLTTYTGYPYPHEMTQSYAAWNINYRNFVAVLRDVYKFKTFANWAEAHQANIRLDAFAFRVTENGTTVPPDISQRREDIAAICFAETRRSYGNNHNNHGSTSTTSENQQSSHSSNHHNTHPYGGYGGGNRRNNNNKQEGNGGGGRTRGGYNGKNFDPNYAAKKAANTRPNNQGNTT
ncbi:uncharacterized protein MELLADRAFT_112806 [Melampsora larici-populina 98AG31]|uniref:Uncharacterized protein n=1 Tax=Melampsora larici-populina (strain 98AG31 / pathotype 3-4-7) TaxID=747676 RepID=F4S7P1_MELLP|nr:uncharacterized protein MELLADRAFT_112806 [Melampsora larici-populina 98AG31]EGF99359.1 hypothetical protein MELLADRAFT_112806 [Melampsora larici-populina 98AG31]